MEGSIKDFRVRVKPSKPLLEFICSLDDCKSMPENVLRIYKENGKNESKEINTDVLPKKIISEWNQQLLKWVIVHGSFYDECGEVSDVLDIILEEQSDEEDSGDPTNKGKPIAKNKCNKYPERNNVEDKSDCSMLEINDLRWLDQLLEKKRAAKECDDFLHELLIDAKLVLPKNEMIQRNPELEARCVRLREQQKMREYRNMTKNVDATRQHLPEDTIAYQMKSINRQLIAVLQFVFSVVAGFAFGFQGLQYMFGDLDFGFRLFLGIICALVIALAEIYFLAKKLNEYDEVVEDIPMPPRQPRPHQD